MCLWQCYFNAGEDRGNKPAKGKHLHLHMLPPLVGHHDSELLSSGGDHEEGEDQPEQLDHLRLPGQHGHHVPLRGSPVTLVHWLATMGLPDIRPSFQNVTGVDICK